MNGLRPRGPGSLEDGGLSEIAPLDARRPDAHRLPGGQHMWCVTVGLRINRDRCDAQAVERADDAARYLPPVGDKDLRECHAGSHTRISRGVGL
jgi:hypothetical protein